ncbi:MAG TPA: outer membrane beta-barrel protein [Dyella sp.]|nr:outer membrane beta-barrel protein [Dyella sp.]
MKKSLLALAFVSAGACALPALAQDAPATTDSATAPTAMGNYQPNQAVGSGNWFLSGSVGQAHISQGPYDDHPTAYAINGGYRWKVGPDLGLGVEVGYNDLGNFKVKNAFNGNDVNLTDQRNAVRGWTAGVNGRIDVYRGLYVSGRAGLYGWESRGYQDPQATNRQDLSNVDFYAGAGVGYDFNDHFGLGLSYDFYHADQSGVSLSTDTASVTAEYRF